MRDTRPENKRKSGSPRQDGTHKGIKCGGELKEMGRQEAEAKANSLGYCLEICKLIREASNEQQRDPSPPL